MRPGSSARLIPEGGGIPEAQAKIDGLPFKAYGALRSFIPRPSLPGGLRSLISTLRNDGEDVDTTKVVLETLLMLFTPDESSPEASDEIALWLADEFTQRQDNITILLDLLETRDFYSRLYSLQLMSHISGARPERTQECILTAPLGISRLVNVLTDSREPVRNEALILLIALTPASEELQKLVAFENAFEILFSLIDAEGSLTLGTEVVEDCLSLLAHLLRYNVSNQSYFRETGCVPKITTLLIECQLEHEGEEATPQYTLVHRDKNVWGLLTIIQLFLIRGGKGTPSNQTAFWQHGVTEQALSIAFGQRFSVSVTSKALATCADLIRGNSPLQERFGDIEVVWGSRKPQDPATNGTAEPERINVIEAFLKLSLEPSPNNLLDARLAACECMKAFFAHHPGIRMHVLRRAIEGHTSGQDRIPNIISVLLTAPESRGNADPYQVWMACVLLFHLIFDDSEAKAAAMKVTEGDAESGEEVVTSVQSVVGNLITGLQRGDDERITVGYLMLLCGWLFEDPDVVNDLLGEGSSIQTLLQEIKHQRTPSRLVPGLCTALLGIIYEFSTRDSPIPRVTLHKLLLDQLGREQYIDKITKLRECPLVRDFEVLPQTAVGQLEGGLPEVFFDRAFVEFLKDNFSRLIRAIDREPGFEISVVANGVEKGISRDLVDTLRAELEDRSQSIQKLESDLVDVQRKLDQELSDHRKTKESSAWELSKAQQSQQALHYSHGQELSRLEEQYQQSKNELLKQHNEQLRAIDNQLKQAAAEYETKSAKVREHHEKETAGLHSTIRGLETQLTKLQEQYTGDSAGFQETIQKLESIITRSREDHAAQVADLQQKLQSMEAALASSKGEHDASIADYKVKIETLESSLATAKSGHEANMSDYKKTIESLESSLAAAKSEHESETAELKRKNDILQSELKEVKERSTKDVDAVNDNFLSKISELEKRASEAESKAKEAEGKAKDAESKIKEAESRRKEAESKAQKEADARKEVETQLAKAQSEAKEKEEARIGTQTELDDLLIVFGDLEAKREKDKKRLKELGQEVSEDEDEDDEDENEEDDVD
ncbi:hypothetical protein N7470_009564 [Penicillium chermesinum]|nr:hypothetical protein N7470_009564 [Penicillium chermesinum]